MYEWSDIDVAGFIGFCMVLPYILDFLNKQAARANQATKIVTVEKPVIQYKYIDRPVISSDSVKSNKINQVQKDLSIFNGCIQCLVSLGMNKSGAKKKTEEMFKTKNYGSVESFLLDVYKK